MTADRIRCCVVGCRRTRRNDLAFREWVCGKHWLLIPKARRRAYGRLVGRLRRGWPAHNGSARAARLWRRLRAIATERAVGL